MSIFVHPKTAKKLDLLKTHLPQVTIFSGALGLGKKQAALNLIAQLEPKHALNIETLNFDRLIVISGDNNSIGIQDVKEVESLLKLTSNDNRYIVVDQAQKLTTEAQNAFLKTLEESPSNTHTFLLTDNTNSLLATVRSRSQVIDFYKPTESQFLAWLKSKNIDSKQALKYYYETSASPRLALDILSNPQPNDSTGLAKKLLSSTPADRLNLLKDAAKDSSDLQEILYSLRTVIRAALQHSIKSRQSSNKITIWKQKLELILDLLKNNKNHVNTKLIIDRLVINL